MVTLRYHILTMKGLKKFENIIEINIINFQRRKDFYEEDIFAISNDSP